MDHDSDPRHLPSGCLLCGRPQPSHPAPSGHLCHTCLRERGEEWVLERFVDHGFATVLETREETERYVGEEEPVSRWTVDSVECRWCAMTVDIGRAALRDEAVIATESLPFERYPHLATVWCQTCAIPNDLLCSDHTRDVVDDHTPIEHVAIEALRPGA